MFGLIELSFSVFSFLMGAFKLEVDCDDDENEEDEADELLESFAQSDFFTICFYSWRPASKDGKFSFSRLHSNFVWQE